jgi:putative SOS response-associated peptidase YedK
VTIDRFTHAGSEVGHGDRAAGLRWGIVAPWRGHGGKRPPPIYIATLAEVAATPVLRDAERCLVDADGFYVRAGTKRELYIVAPATPIAFAGVCTTHRDDGIASFALLVGPAPAGIAMLTEIAPLVGPDASVCEWRAHRAAEWNPSQGQLF